MLLLSKIGKFTCPRFARGDDHVHPGHVMFDVPPTRTANAYTSNTTCMVASSVVTVRDVETDNVGMLAVPEQEQA